MLLFLHAIIIRPTRVLISDFKQISMQTQKGGVKRLCRFFSMNQYELVCYLTTNVLSYYTLAIDTC